MTTVKEETVQQVHTLRILDSNGDTRIAWSPADAGTVAEVQEKFDEMVKGLRYLAYTKPTDGSTGEAIRTFDPEVEADIVVVPQMQGG